MEDRGRERGGGDAAGRTEGGKVEREKMTERQNLTGGGGGGTGKELTGLGERKLEEDVDKEDSLNAREMLEDKKDDNLGESWENKDNVTWDNGQEETEEGGSEQQVATPHPTEVTENLENQEGSAGLSSSRKRRRRQLVPPPTEKGDWVQQIEEEEDGVMMMGSQLAPPPSRTESGVAGGEHCAPGSSCLAGGWDGVEPTCLCHLGTNGPRCEQGGSLWHHTEDEVAKFVLLCTFNN